MHMYVYIHTLSVTHDPKLKVNPIFFFFPLLVLEQNSWLNDQRHYPWRPSPLLNSLFLLIKGVPRYPSINICI